jgi:hypothetical protein
LQYTIMAEAAGEKPFFTNILLYAHRKKTSAIPSLRTCTPFSWRNCTLPRYSLLALYNIVFLVALLYMLLPYLRLGFTW